MTTTNFSSGTLIESTWLNDVDAHVYDQNTVAHESDKIEYTPSGTGVETTNVQTKLSQYPHPDDYATNDDYLAACLALKTNQNFAQNGAVIHRLSDRVLIGGAVDNDGVWPNVEKDWLTVFQEGTGLLSGTVSNTVLASLNSTSAGSACAGMFGAQSKYFNSDGTSCLPLVGIAVNNNTTYATRVWGGYFEAHKEYGTTGTGCRGIEIDVRVETGVAEIDPTPNQQTTTSCLQLGAGAGVATTANSVNVGAAIQILNNGTRFRKGIVFLNDSLEGTDGTSGAATAVAMSAYHNVDWYDTSGVLVARVSAPSATYSGELRFTSVGPSIYGLNGTRAAFFTDAVSSVNYAAIASAAAAGAPSISATGTDTDIDLQLISKGTGVIRFGTWTSNADTAINGYVTIKDSGGTTRKLATIA